jgi:hypothetical protein
MRLLVVSDTHGDCSGLVTVLNLLGDTVDALIHLGDGSGDIGDAALMGCNLPRIYQVRGNVDSNWSIPPRVLVPVGRQTILAAHGQLYLGNGSHEPFVQAALASKAQAFFFGHTHMPFREVCHGVLLLNPGSLARPRGNWGPSFAIVEAPPDDTSWFDVKLFELHGSRTNPQLSAIHL